MSLNNGSFEDLTQKYKNMSMLSLRERERQPEGDKQEGKEGKEGSRSRRSGCDISHSSGSDSDQGVESDRAE